jgi:hypothetical protein
MVWCQLIYNSNLFLRKKKRTKCVKIIFISEFKVISMGRNESSLAWMTILLHNSVADITYIYMHTG